MNLEELLSLPIDPTLKGVPDLEGRPLTLRDIPAQRWNLLAGDLPAPVATLDRAALIGNSLWMREFVARHGFMICPHGKTTMAPQLFQMQLADGAWGITVASVQQMQVCARFGVKRILLANQLVGSQEIRAVLRALDSHSDMDFYCVVDSAENLRQLRAALQSHGSARPLQVLLEGGAKGGRTGCRTLPEAMALAREIHDLAPRLLLAGVEGFEGAIARPDPAQSAAAVGEYIEYLTEILRACGESGLFATRRPVLTLGGSVYFDLVATHPSIRSLQGQCDVVLRSGCYLTHDSRMLTENFERMRQRTPELAAGGAFLPALTVWGRVQSRPEAGLAIVNVGKRDISYDVDLPVVERWHRAELHDLPVAFPGPAAVTQLNDQHAFLEIAVHSPVRVGDLVGLGISHPCTTFDKWRLLHVLDERCNVVEGILTFF